MRRTDGVACMGVRAESAAPSWRGAAGRGALKGGEGSEARGACGSARGEGGDGGAHLGAQWLGATPDDVPGDVGVLPLALQHHAAASGVVSAPPRPPCTPGRAAGRRNGLEHGGKGRQAGRAHWRRASSWASAAALASVRVDTRLEAGRQGRCGWRARAGYRPQAAPIPQAHPPSAAAHCVAGCRCRRRAAATARPPG